MQSLITRCIFCRVRRNCSQQPTFSCIYASSSTSVGIGIGIIIIIILAAPRARFLSVKRYLRVGLEDLNAVLKLGDLQLFLAQVLLGLAPQSVGLAQLGFFALVGRLGLAVPEHGRKERRKKDKLG